MSRRPNRYNKRDLNETIIINTFHDLKIPWMEAGPLDGWIYLKGWIPIEIKSETGRLTKGQQDFVDACTHFNRPYALIRRLQDVLELVAQRGRIP